MARGHQFGSPPCRWTLLPINSKVTIRNCLIDRTLKGVLSVHLSIQPSIYPYIYPSTHPFSISSLTLFFLSLHVIVVWYACMCGHMFKYVSDCKCLCAGTYSHVCACMWRPMADTGNLSWLSFHLIKKTGISIKTNSTNLASLTCSGDLLSLPFAAGITAGCYTQGIDVGIQRQSYSCTACSLTTEF